MLTLEIKKVGHDYAYLATEDGDIVDGGVLTDPPRPISSPVGWKELLRMIAEK